MESSWENVRGGFVRNWCAREGWATTAALAEGVDAPDPPGRLESSSSFGMGDRRGGEAGTGRLPSLISGDMAAGAVVLLVVVLGAAAEEGGASTSPGATL